MAKGIPNLIAKSIVNGIKAGMNWNETQVMVSILPVLDVGWEGQVMAQVVLGAIRPYGEGKGQQEGGGLQRTQDIDIILYYRLNMDVHGESSELLTMNSEGLNDVIERIRRIFEFTYLDYHPNPSVSLYLLLEPMFFKNQTSPVWEDEQLGIAKVVLSYECNFGQGSFNPPMSSTPQQIESI